MRLKPNGFPRTFRIRSGKDFSRAYQQGSRARGDVLLVVACPNGLGWTRLGLSVGKRIWKGAVGRNRVRRIFREAFRLEHDSLPPGMDLVLIPAQPSLKPELEATRRELVRLARKATRRNLEKVQKAQEQAAPKAGTSATAAASESGSSDSGPTSTRATETRGEQG